MPDMSDNPAIKDGYPHVSMFIMSLLFIYVFNHYFELGTRIELLGKIRFEFILAIILTVFGIFTGNIFRLGDNRKVLYALLFFCLLVAIQVPLSQDFNLSLEIFLDRFVKLSFMALFVAAFVRSPTHMKIFLAGFLLACLKLGQEGLVGKVGGTMMWENEGVMRLHGHGAIYGGPNSYSGMALGTIPFLYCFFPLFSWPIRSVIAVQFLLAMNIVVFTGSRTGYVGFLYLLGYILLKGKNKFRVFLAICGLVIVGVIVVPGQYMKRFETIYTGKEIEGASMDTRKVILKDAVDIFSSNPLGIGVGAFPTVRQRTFGRSQDTHNLYLEILTNTGIQGGIAFLILIVVVYRSLSDLEARYHALLERVKRLTKDQIHSFEKKENIVKHIKDLRFMGATCQAVKLFLLVRLVVGLFGMDLYEIYWWFAIGLTLALGNIYPWAENITSSLMKEVTEGEEVMQTA